MDRTSEFTALDVETANHDWSSICAIGWVHYTDGVEVGTSHVLVDPACEFDSFNIRIHGISPDKVRDKPKLAEALPELFASIADKVVVTHSGFDRIALEKACRVVDIKLPNVRWLDSCALARRCWHGMTSYRLHALCVALQYPGPFRANGVHCPLEDARAAAFVVLKACEQADLDVTSLLSLHSVPLPEEPRISAQTRSKPSVRRNGDGHGPLIGEVICFTGALSMTRKEAADIVAKAGGDVVPSITTRSTMLVLGAQDISRLAGKDKSAKHLKAEDLIFKGHPIRIIGESDFVRLVSIAD